MEFTGSRVAFSLFGIDIYWYGIIIASAIMLALYLMHRELERMGQDGDLVYELALWILPAAIIGARIYYVIFEWDQFNGDLLKILNIRSGGLAIHGGVIAGTLAGLIFCRKKSIDILFISDVASIFLPLGQAIGRWGNFVNNEAHGGPTDLPWGLIIDGQKYHPTFLYESLANIILFTVLFILFRRGKMRRGYTSSIYLMGYGVIRFFIEGLRTDSLWIGPFRQAQIMSVVWIILGLALLIKSIKSKKEYSIKNQKA